MGWTITLILITLLPWTLAFLLSLILSLILKKTVRIRRFGFLSLHDITISTSVLSVHVTHLRVYFPLTFSFGDISVTLHDSPSPKTKASPITTPNITYPYTLISFIPALFTVILPSITVNYVSQATITVTLSDITTTVTTDKSSSASISASTTCSHVSLLPSKPLTTKFGQTNIVLDNVVLDFFFSPSSQPTVSVSCLNVKSITSSDQFNSHH
ncbi:hypothetical protein GEMRC1_001585 [Eukaryota sp. GEM-RC1]